MWVGEIRVYKGAQSGGRFPGDMILSQIDLVQIFGSYKKMTGPAESRADHGLENFGDSLYPYERNGRHVGTRTPDLYRVKVAL
jgi:hypothetical protein